MKTGSITYNGKNSLTDLGIYVTGSGSFDAAELDVDRYEVAGRNGDIIIPKNRYKNISISYPAFIPKEFDGKVQSVRNWLRSAKTYARLEDTYDMNHFRLGLASGIQSFEPANRNDASNFALTFDCKPQRFLKTGETPLKVEPEAHSYSGEIVEFETVAVDDMTKAEVSLSPIQDLHGYSSPWAGGAGVNKFDPNTVTAGFIGSNGLLNNQGPVNLEYISDYIPVSPFTRYTVMYSAYESGDSPYVAMCWYDSNKTFLRRDFSTAASYTQQSHENAAYCRAFTRTFGHGTDKCYFAAGTSTTFSPWQNICPISGHTEAKVWVQPTHDTSANPTVTISLGQTVYGGTLDVVTGQGEITWANIASYSGESLPGEWISDRDVYAEGTTPTIGAQVVYELATPIQLSLTPQEIDTLLGQNVMWGNGEIEIEFSEPFSLTNPTQFEARPLLRVVNPEEDDVIDINGKTITFTDDFTGEMFIDCETMDAFSSSGTNLNSYITATDFPVLKDGLNIVTFTGSGDIYIVPRWWEL